MCMPRVAVSSFLPCPNVPHFPTLAFHIQWLFQAPRLTGSCLLPSPEISPCPAGRGVGQGTESEAGTELDVQGPTHWNSEASGAGNTGLPARPAPRSAWPSWGEWSLPSPSTACTTWRGEGSHPRSCWDPSVLAPRHALDPILCPGLGIEPRSPDSPQDDRRGVGLVGGAPFFPAFSCHVLEPTSTLASLLFGVAMETSPCHLPCSFCSIITKEDPEGPGVLAPLPHPAVHRTGGVGVSGVHWGVW